MFYKLSNTASQEEIEKQFDATFKFPNLYAPSAVINGLEESMLSVITIDDPDRINFGIWGLLPKELEDNWKVYQDLTNTLNVNIEELDSENSQYAEALDQRRCIIIITGFFTSALHEGMMNPHHVYLKNHKPFAIAGIYSQLADGFITCSILVKRAGNEMGHIPNMLSYKPVIFDHEDQAHWLNKSFKYDDLKDLIVSHQSLEHFSHPIPKDFYDNDLVYKKILDSKVFENFLKASS